MSKAQREVTKILYNRFYTTEIGEEICEYEVGKRGVKYIIEVLPSMSGQNKIIYEVFFEDETMEAIFHPSNVFFKINDIGNPF